MSEVCRGAAPERSDQEKAAPVLVVDERLREAVWCEFDMLALGELMRTKGMNEAFIRGTTVKVHDIDSDTRASWESSRLFDGEMPAGEYDKETQTAYVYDFEDFRERRADPNSRLSSYSPYEAVAWLEDEMNDTIVHEIGHAIYTERVRKAMERDWIAVYGSLGAIAAGFSCIGIARMLGPKGKGVLGDIVSRRLCVNGKRLAKVGSVGIGALAGWLAAEVIDSEAKYRWPGYSQWRYDHTDLNERYARKFAEEYRGVKVVKLSPLYDSQA